MGPPFETLFFSLATDKERRIFPSKSLFFLGGPPLLPNPFAPGNPLFSGVRAMPLRLTSRYAELSHSSLGGRDSANSVFSLVAMLGCIILPTLEPTILYSHLTLSCPPPPQTPFLLTNFLLAPITLGVT